MIRGAYYERAQSPNGTTKLPVPCQCAQDLTNVILHGLGTPQRRSIYLNGIFMGQLRTANKRQKRKTLAAAQRHQRLVDIIQTSTTPTAEGSI